MPGEGEVAPSRVGFNASPVAGQRVERLAVADGMCPGPGRAALHITGQRIGEVGKLAAGDVVKVNALPVATASIGTQREAKAGEAPANPRLFGFRVGH